MFFNSDSKEFLNYVKQLENLKKGTDDLIKKRQLELDEIKNLEDKKKYIKGADDEIIEKLVERYIKLPCEEILVGFEYSAEAYNRMHKNYIACLTHKRHSQEPGIDTVCRIVFEQSQFIGILTINLGEAYERKCLSAPVKNKKYNF